MNISIRSQISSAVLTFSSCKDDYILVKYESDLVSFSKEVKCYSDCKSFINTIDFINSSRSGWDEELVWSSVEGDVELQFIYNEPNGINVLIAVWNIDEVEDWSIKSKIITKFDLISVDLN